MVPADRKTTIVIGPTGGIYDLRRSPRSDLSTGPDEGTEEDAET
jgi:hypothetical protein